LSKDYFDLVVVAEVAAVVVAVVVAVEVEEIEVH